MSQREDHTHLDQRIIAFKRRTGELTGKDIAKHLSSLPDSSNNAEYINVTADHQRHVSTDASPSGLTFVAADTD